MKSILTIVILIFTMFTGCNDSSSTQKVDTISTISNEKEAARAVSLVESLHLNTLTKGISLSIGTSQATNKAPSREAGSFPIPYQVYRDCAVSGTADTVGEMTSANEYLATSDFNECSHINGLVVNGSHVVDAILIDDRLTATLTQNEIEITMGDLTMSTFSPMKFYSNRDFSLTETILQGEVGLVEYSNSYSALFNDFNVTIDALSQTMELNGTVDITVCGTDHFEIETIVPVTTAPNGTFTSGTLNINGATFQYNGDKTVTVTLSSENQYTIPQGIISSMCDLDAGSVLNGSTRDAQALTFLSGVNITASTGLGDTLAIYTTSSDASGNFRLQDLHPGVYTLDFIKSGYISATAQHTVGENVEENFGLIDLLPEGYEDQIHTFSGSLIDAQSGLKVSEATVIIREGHNNPTGTIIATIQTDTNGNFTTNLPTGNYTLELTKDGYTTSTSTSISINDDLHQDLTIAPIIAATDAIITLSWAESPRDLDSHLEKEGVYHIYYSNTSATLPSGEKASLDVDDTTSFGPETITLNNLETTVDYRYYVYQYSSDGAISTSNSVVTVNFGGSTYTFRPPNQQGKSWTVFTIENGVIIPCTGTCIQ